MGDHYRQSNVGYSYINQTKMENDYHKKTMIILVIVVGCFAVLWPKVFYPMLVNSANEHIQPSAIDKTTGCCYVLSETDVDTIKIMSELCGNIIREQMGDVPLTGKQVINICQDEVLKTCGIDISAVLQEQVRLGHTTKQILDEIRSLNGSLCLKYNFGVQPWRLGVPHIVTLKNFTYNIRQERSPHVRSEMVHPAFRERGRAIPKTPQESDPPKRIVEGKPGPIPGMRPTIGGAGHVVPPPKHSAGSMGIIMPVYTIGIVIFFTYTLMKIIFKKHPDTDYIYSTMEHDARYRSQILGDNVSRGSRDSGSCKLVVNAMSALLEEVDQQIEARRRSSENSMQDTHSTNLSNGSVKKEEKPSVKIMSMETSESCEGGKKWQSSNSSVLPQAPSMTVNDDVASPQEIYLDKVLPPQSQILVADSAVETEQNSGDDPAVILAGKMTLSVISLENENLEIGDTSPLIELLNEEFVKDSKPVLEDVISDIIDKALECLDNDESNAHGDTQEIQDLPDNAEKSIRNSDLDGDKTDLNGSLHQNSEQENSNSLSQEICDRNDANKTGNKFQTESNPVENQDLKATSSEESVNTVVSVTNEETPAKVKAEDEGGKDKIEHNASDEEESEVEYEEESEEEIEESEEEDEEEEVELDETVQGPSQQEISGRLNPNGNAVLINGASSSNGTHEEGSDDEEIIEEIIEEYSEEEDENDSDDETNDVIYLSSNGNRED